MSSLYWNLALDENGGPQLDGASSCEHEGGCTGLVEVKSDHVPPDGNETETPLVIMHGLLYVSDTRQTLSY